MNIDICIIGAGPSGATLSLFLAKKGIEHLIVDAAVFPRDKICGDGLDLKVWRILNQLDPNISASDVYEDNEFVDCWGARLHTPYGRVLDFAHTPTGNQLNYPLYRISKRKNFDNFLVKKINPKYADFRQGTKITKIERDGKGWVLQAESATEKYEIRCKLLIGADGDHSIVLRTLGDRKIDRKHYAAIMRQYWTGIKGFHERNLLEILFLKKDYPLSYFWMFPLPNGEANVGFGMHSSIIAAKKLNIREILNEIITTHPMCVERFKNAKPLEEPIGWGAPLASKRRKNFGDGFLLLGDAGSLISPMSGEGIGPAMVSAYMAADFIENALKLNRFNEDVFKNFDREIYRYLNEDIRVVEWLSAMKWTKLSYPDLVEAISYTPFLKLRFGLGVPKWTRTAYEKPMKVNV
jgi:menaquinone-9 beta-reductase